MADITLSNIEFRRLAESYLDEFDVEESGLTQEYFEEFAKNWEFTAFENSEIGLDKGYAVERFIFKHLPSNKYYETTAVYTSDEGYVNPDNDVLLLNEVFPEEYTATRFVKTKTLEEPDPLMVNEGENKYEEASM